jgi:Flp pilus assembly pilin Flp
MYRLLNTFINDESGAVTVDWTVMTAAIAGLGIATYGVVSGGINDLSNDVSAQLSGQDILASFSGAFSTITLASNDFTGGDRGDWIGGQIFDMGGTLGELLAIGAGQTAELALEFPEGASVGTVTFDLIGGDSGDGELVSVTSNGQGVLLGTYNFRPETVELTFEIPDVPGVTVTTELVSENSNIGGSGWTDAVTRVSLTVEDPGTDFVLAARSNTNQSISDEYFGIDNVTVTAE